MVLHFGMAVTCASSCEVEELSLGPASLQVGTISVWIYTWRMAHAIAEGVLRLSPHRAKPLHASPTNRIIKAVITILSTGGLSAGSHRCRNDVIANGFTRGIFGLCTAIFDAVSLGDEKYDPWHVEMHQFRIEVTEGQRGLPTPEGAHRDGVNWVCVLLVNRHNVSSGVTQISDPDGRSLGEFALTDPLDAVFLDDRRVFHGVTPIVPVDPAFKASRDVLVLTYRRETLR
jgi:hypothetical protein